MNPTEAAKVLAKAAAYDNRQATQAAALAWAEALDRDMPSRTRCASWASTTATSAPG